MLIRLIIGIAVFYLFFALFLFVTQRNAIYFPDDTDFWGCEQFGDKREVGSGGTRVYVQENGSDIVAVLYHGNAGSACGRLYWKEVFEEKGYDYLIVEYEGYGGQGKPSQQALLGNVRDVVEYLDEKDYDQTLLVGESIGNALAAYHSSLRKPDRVVIWGGFSSLEDVAQSKYPFFPVRLLLKDKYPTVKWLDANVSVIIHGTQDTIVPLRFGEALYERIEGKKQFVPIEGIGHNDFYTDSRADTMIREAIRLKKE